MIVIAVFGGTAAGCAPARPRADGQAIVVSRKGYRVTAPPGWEPIASSGADVALRQPARQAGLMAHGTCGGREARRPLPVLARHLRFGLRDVQGVEQAPAAIAGLPGLRSRFTARLDGVPVSVLAVTLEARGCVYDLVVVAPPAEVGAVAGDFDRFAESFGLTGESP